jgi:hypothetical protein
MVINKDATKDATKDAKPAAAPSMKGHQKTKGLELAPGVQQESVSSQKSSLGLQSRNEKADEELQLLGNPQAEKLVEDDGTNTRRRALLCRGMVVILLGIIIGTVVGTRDTSPNTVAPLNNSLCEEPHPIMLGGSVTAVSLQDAAQQYVDFCEDENKSAHFQPGLWYRVRGVNRGV